MSSFLSEFFLSRNSDNFHNFLTVKEEVLGCCLVYAHCASADNGKVVSESRQASLNGILKKRSKSEILRLISYINYGPNKLHDPAQASVFSPVKGRGRTRFSLRSDLVKTFHNYASKSVNKEMNKRKRAGKESRQWYLEYFKRSMLYMQNKI